MSASNTSPEGKIDSLKKDGHAKKEIPWVQCFRLKSAAVKSIMWVVDDAASMHVVIVMRRHCIWHMRMHACAHARHPRQQRPSPGLFRGTACKAVN
jgi:hypothetical protein